MQTRIRTLSAWLFFAVVHTIGQSRVALALPLPYQPTSINRTCVYEALNVSASLFFGTNQAVAEALRTSGTLDYLFPLDDAAAVYLYNAPWQACWGPGETFRMDALQLGSRLPCYWSRNRWGRIDYKEEHGCDELLRANCYCYALGRYVGSYCEPGLGGTGRLLHLPISSCDAPVAALLADGARRVDRATVYSKSRKPSGHYVMLAVKPSSGPTDTGDFHFWRLDAGGVWSYKAGDTLVRNTFRNGTAILDAELASARGAYTHFCGYFEVQPSSHKLKGNGYFYSSIPTRVELWRAAQVQVRVTQRDSMSAAWSAAYGSYFTEAGWEDPPPPPPPAPPLGNVVWPLVLERQRVLRPPAPPSGAPHGRQPHWYSTRPIS